MRKGLNEALALIEKGALIHPRERIDAGDELPAGSPHGRLCEPHLGFRTQAGKFCLAC